MYSQMQQAKIYVRDGEFAVDLTFDVDNLLLIKTAIFQFRIGIQSSYREKSILKKIQLEVNENIDRSEEYGNHIHAKKKTR